MLDTLNLMSGQMFVQLRSVGPGASPDADVPDAVLNQGQPTKVGDYNIEFVREKRYTLLQVASNPGIPIFWTAAFLLVGGLFITFYLPHRRIRAIFDSGGPEGSTQLAMAPLAKRDWSGQKDFRNSVADLSKRFGTELSIREKIDPIGDRSDGALPETA
jgi:hypothetical protein